MRAYVAAACICLFSAWGHSQECTFTIRGEVIDIHDQTPLNGATIVVAGMDLAVLSDLNGTYSISGLCEGQYVLQVSHPACTTEVFRVNVNDNTYKVLKLEHHLESLNEVIITGKGYTTKTESLLENTLSDKQLEGFSANALGDALRNLSGVSSLNTGNAIVKPVINGLHSSRVTLINNGVRMQDQEWGVEHSPNIDINTAGFVTVLKGASALQYTGDAIGGIVISEPQKIPIKDTLYGKSLLSFSSNGRGGSSTTSVSKGFSNGWYAQLQGTVKRYGDFETPDYVLSNTGYFERDFMIRLGLNKIDWGLEAHYTYFKNEIAILRASHLGGAEDLVQSINSPRPLIIEDFTYDLDRPKQEVTHQIARISGFRKFSSKSKLEFSYDFQSNQRYEYDIRRGDDAGKPSVDLRLNTHNAQLGYETSLRDWDFKIGAVVNLQDNFANPATGVRRLIPDYDQLKIGGYAIANWQASERWALEMGARYDYTFMDVYNFYRTSFWESRGYDEQFSDIVVEEYGNQILVHPELSFNNISATFGTSYRLGPQWTLFGNFSYANRAPNASELFSEGLHHSASRIELGDLRFDSETSKKWNITLHKKGKLSFSMNPYLNLLEDFIIIEPTGVQQTLRGNFQVWEYRQTDAVLWGLDLDYSIAFCPTLSFIQKFSMLKAYEKDTEIPLINMPPVSISNELKFEKNRFSASLKQEYFFRQNNFPDTNFEVFLPDTETTEVVDVSTPPEGYQLWDVSLNYSFPIFKTKTMGVGLTVTNIWNTVYRNYLNRLRYYADDLGRNIMLNTKINF